MAAAPALSHCWQAPREVQGATTPPPYGSWLRASSGGIPRSSPLCRSSAHVSSRLGGPAAVELVDNFVDDCRDLLVRNAAFLAPFDDLAIERDSLSPIRHPRL